MTNSTRTTLFHLLFLLLLSAGHLNARRQEDPEENGEEELSGQVPRFLVTDEEISAAETDDVSLVCEVDKLGPYLIMFKKGGLSSIKLISIGPKVFNSEYSERVELLTLPEDKGMTLLLKNVSKADAGNYVCTLNHPGRNDSVTYDLKIGVPTTNPAPSTGGASSFKSLLSPAIIVMSLIHF